MVDLTIVVSVLLALVLWTVLRVVVLFVFATLSYAVRETQTGLRLQVALRRWGVYW